VIRIESVDNGFITENSSGSKKVFTDIEELFKHLLLSLEGKGESFGGRMYARVAVEYERERRGNSENHSGGRA
jgi:hypothetical protein